MLRLTGRALGLALEVRSGGRFIATSAVPCQQSTVDADARSQAAKTWTPSVDPFTSAMQSKAEKELLDEVLKQAEEQEQAEDAAEQVCYHDVPSVILRFCCAILIPSC